MSPLQQCTHTAVRPCDDDDDDDNIMVVVAVINKLNGSCHVKVNLRHHDRSSWQCTMASTAHHYTRSATRHVMGV